MDHLLMISNLIWINMKRVLKEKPINNCGNRITISNGTARAKKITVESLQLMVNPDFNKPIHGKTK